MPRSLTPLLKQGPADMYEYIYIYIYIEQASLMHRRAIVLAFLPAALEVLAFSFVKCNSSEAFRSMCRRHEYACVSCLCMSCVVLSGAVLGCVVLPDCNNSRSRNEMCLVLGMLCSKS